MPPKRSQSEFRARCREYELALYGVEDMTIDTLIREHTLNVLRRFSGNRRQTYRALGIGARTLTMWLSKWGVPPCKGPVKGQRVQDPARRTMP